MSANPGGKFKVPSSLNLSDDGVVGSNNVPAFQMDAKPHKRLEAPGQP